MTRIGSLCSGYGGLDMGVQAALGGSVAWHSEVEPAANRILAYRYPDVPNLGDLTAVDWAQVEPVDVLTAGYPCQPFSHAGKRKGAADVRHLWPYVADAIRVLRPGLFVGENVAGHLSLGFGRVLYDLSAVGYVGRWDCLRASDVSAPHGRKRVFIVAWPAANAAVPGSQGGADAGIGKPDDDGQARRGEVGSLLRGDVPGILVDWRAYEPAIRRWEAVLGRVAPAPTEPSRNGGQRLSPRFVEFLMGLPDGWVTDVPGVGRNAQLKALGNGVVPQQAEVAVRMLLGGSAVVASGVDALLPTPAVNDMGAGKTPDAWDAWTDRMRAAHGNGNGHGKSLAIEAARLSQEVSA